MECIKRGLINFVFFQLYSCMMCDYKDPVRKNLYDHWRIQHKIQVLLRPDGSAKCVISDREIDLVDYHAETSEVL